MSLSLVIDAFRKGANSNQRRGSRVPQTGRGPTVKGIARGTMGAIGSRGLQSRNVDASLMKDRDALKNSPVMQAFLRRKRRRLI